jgi:hypothetical protein
MWEALIKVVLYLGPGFLALAITGLVTCVRDRQLRLGALLGLQVVFSFVLFARVQDFDIHHYYLLLVPLALLTARAVIVLVPLVRAWRSWLAGAAVCGLLLADLIGVLTSAGQSFPPGAALILPSGRVEPLVRTDFETVGELGQFVDGLVAGDAPHTMYVVASSSLMNRDTVVSALPAKDQYKLARDRILWTHDVDGRDTFPADVWPTASFVLLATPTQYHLGPQNQYLIGVLAQELGPGGHLSRFYQQLPEQFELQDSVHVTILQRTGVIPSEEIARVEEEFNAARVASIGSQSR